MKFKLWISPEGLPHLKGGSSGKKLKTHLTRIWKCYNNKDQLNDMCITFGRKEYEDAGFSIVCTIEDAKHLAKEILNAIDKGLENA